MKTNSQRTQRKKSSRKRDPWKIAFTTLLALMIALTAVVLVKVYTPGQDVQKVVETKLPADQATAIDVKMNKEQLSSAVNYYLNHQQKGKNNIQYKFILDQSAILIGTTKVFGDQISFTLYAKPTLNKDGNILLKIKSVAIGSLNAPKSFILSYVKNRFKAGPAVQISPKKSEIVLNLNQVKTKQGIQAKGQQLDLKKDDIRFRILIPLGGEDN
ncbi:hypothetical protein LPAF129_01190 [Ligilactobacillus pabuli]|uniref:DUF2140 family protein n=1 Tax=Ligilactobacillus pabuli TaxID=2886039 RepID=A0ABQ5JED8_9LACO|nr:YpmS family protein [Ligilactobacillus pabuli]GKS80434.1 hypothetical protein LPAF129_01190 [Ligilactobacillus pabuli]